MLHIRACVLWKKSKKVSIAICLFDVDINSYFKVYITILENIWKNNIFIFHVKFVYIIHSNAVYGTLFFGLNTGILLLLVEFYSMRMTTLNNYAQDRCFN